MTRLWRAFIAWLRPEPPASVRCDFDTLALARGGGLFRFRTRNTVAPVSRFRRLGDAVWGAVVALACVSAVIMIKGGTP